MMGDGVAERSKALITTQTVQCTRTSKRPICLCQADMSSRFSFLLATSRRILLPLTRNDLPKHDHTIAVHEGNARETLTVLECVANKRLLRLEAALRHLI